MFKFVTIYRRVDDETALETFFAETHLPLAERLPGLLKSEVSRVTGKPGGESRFHLVYELYFAGRPEFEQAWLTETGVALLAALKPWADARLLTWFFADSYEEASG
jgi:uncharacterized protein (TIGR02118 family)